MFPFKQIRNSLVIIAVILVMIFFNTKGWLSWPKNFAWRLSSPFLTFFERTSNFVSDQISLIFMIKDLNQENRNLKRTNQDLLKTNVALKEVARENELLRQRLALGQENQEKLVMAEVVGYNTELSQYLLINKGRTDGLTEGMAVVTTDNFLVGKIVEPELNFAKVLLITDSNSLINVLSQETRTDGIIKGSHSFGLTMEMIPVDREVKKNEMVLTSGLNDVIPQGIIVGQISGIISKETEIYQKATVLPAADFRNLEEVFIIVE